MGSILILIKHRDTHTSVAWITRVFGIEGVGIGHTFNARKATLLDAIFL